MKKLFLTLLILLSLSGSSLYAFDLLNRPRFIGEVGYIEDANETRLGNHSELSLFVAYEDFTFSWENKFNHGFADITYFTADYTMFIGHGWSRPEIGFVASPDSTLDYGSIGWTLAWRFHSKGWGSRANADIGHSNLINYFALEESEELRKDSLQHMMLGDIFMTAEYQTIGYRVVKTGADMWFFDRMIQVFADYTLRWNELSIFQSYKVGWSVHISIFYGGSYVQDSDMIFHGGISF